MSNNFKRGSIESINNWFNVAKPSPTAEDASVQLGVHIEEFVEMLETFKTDSSQVNSQLEEAITILTGIALSLKTEGLMATIHAPVLFLDSLCDQVVTAIGTANFHKYDAVRSMIEVDASNYSKFFNGAAILNKDGKIIKGPNYFPPKLEQFIPREN